jgi:hypothetical protein
MGIASRQLAEVRFEMSAMIMVTRASNDFNIITPDGAKIGHELNVTGRRAPVRTPYASRAVPVT